MDGGWDDIARQDAEHLADIGADRLPIGCQVESDKFGRCEVVAEIDGGTAYRVRGLQNRGEWTIRRTHLRPAADPLEWVRDEIKAVCAKRGLEYGMQVNVACDDPWIAGEGKPCVHIPTGRRGIITSWQDPVRWDDRHGKWVDCRPDHPEVHFQTLGLTSADGSTWWCSDLDRLYGAECEDAVPPPAPLHFLSYDEMVALPEPEWLVEGLVMQKTSALLFGRSNSFKSFLGVDIGGSVATGRSWHGGQVRQPGPVLYVATEGALGVAKQRIPGWMEAHGIPLEERRSLYLYPQEIALDDEAAIDALLRSCALLKGHRDPSKPWDSPAGAFRLVVVDIFGASMNGPEVSDETARAWVRNVNRIMREVGCAVLTIAHTGWADETRARMHTHFWGSFDTRLKAEGDKNARTTVLSVDRHKDADSAGEWGFRLEEVPVPNGARTTLIPRLSDEVETKRSRCRMTGAERIAMQALSEALIEHGTTKQGPNYPNCPVVSTDQWRAMCDRHGLTSSDDVQTKGRTFRRCRDSLHQKGAVRIFDDFVWRAEA